MLFWFLIESIDKHEPVDNFEGRTANERLIISDDILVMNTIQKRKMKYVRKEENLIIRSTVKI